MYFLSQVLRFFFKLIVFMYDIYNPFVSVLYEYPFVWLVFVNYPMNVKCF